MGDRDPFFSVIIPTYNRVDLLASTIESVLNQDFESYEIIVIDDGSSDKTRELLEEEYANLKCVFQENKGVSFARNVGVDNALGEYICYLDSDDLWDVGKLGRLKKVIMDHPEYDVYFHDHVKHNIKLERPYSVTNSQMFPYIFKFMEKRDDIWGVEKGGFFKLVFTGYPFYPSAVCIHKSVHQQYRWDPDVLKSEDFNLMLRISNRYSACYLDECLATIRVHGGNKSRDMGAKERIILSTMLAYKKLYPKNIVGTGFQLTVFKKGLRFLKNRMGSFLG